MSFTRVLVEDIQEGESECKLILGDLTDYQDMLSGGQDQVNEFEVKRTWIERQMEQAQVRTLAELEAIAALDQPGPSQQRC